MNLEKSIVYLNEVQKSIKRRSKLSAFDYYIFQEIISKYTSRDEVLYVSDFISLIADKTYIDKTKINTALKKLNKKGFIYKYRSEKDERKFYLSIDQKQYELYKDLSCSVSQQLNKLKYRKDKVNETL